MTTPKEGVKTENAPAPAVPDAAAAAAQQAELQKYKDEAKAATDRAEKAEAEAAKERGEKENYKAGLLARKEFDKSQRKLTAEQLADPAKVTEHVEAVIAEKELEKKAEADAAKAMAEQQESARIRAENEELKRSLAAKDAGSAPAPGAAVNPNSAAPAPGFWPEEKRENVRSLLRRNPNYTPAQIEAMVKRSEQIAAGNAGTEPRGNDMVPTRTY